MLKCKCPVCENGYTQQVNDYLSLHGFQKTLEMAQGLVPNLKETVLRSHFKRFEIEIPQESTTSLIPLKLNLQDIDFTDRDIDLSDPASLITHIQKIHLYLYLEQVDIVAQQLHLYKQGERTTPPTTDLLNLSRLLKLLNDVSGLKSVVEESTAIKILESKGYKISGAMEGENGAI